MSTSAYPVHVDATLDSHLSRWLWLVKWFLAIPHYVVLVFLWAAFVVLSIFAFFAIAFTGHYPRSIFDFNVGVLRWSWRVAYYTNGALATDRYPPFTLAEVPDYPAHLTVDYPEHLSRGLVWVKWWLLAIPHYLIVGLLLSGGLYFAWDTTTAADGAEWTGGWGLISLLAFIAAVALLFTGRYPQQIFDLVLGLNRWVLRVAAYASLMTDEYPPFRLDMGGQDPSPAQVALSTAPAGGAVTEASAAPAAAPAAPAAPTATTPTSERGEAGPPAAPSAAPPAGGGGVTWGPGRVVTVVVAALVFLIAGGFLAGGTTLLVADQTLRDDDGFLMSGTKTLSTGSYAIASEPLTIDTGTAGDWMPQSLIGEVAVRADAPGNEEIFVGVARTSDAEAYLSDVRHTTLVDLEGADATPVYRDSAGGAPEVLPDETDIWASSQSGPGGQELSWDLESGDWTVVVMNPDGSTDVTAAMSAGATVPVLGGVVVALLVTGGVLLVISIALVLLALNAGRGNHSGGGTAGGTAGGTGGGTAGGPTGGAGAPEGTRP